MREMVGGGEVCPKSRRANGTRPFESFRVNVSDEVLTDLAYRLQNTRFVDRVEDAAFNYGFDSDYMKQVQRYWLEKIQVTKSLKNLKICN